LAIFLDEIIPLRCGSIKILLQINDLHKRQHHGTTIAYSKRYFIIYFPENIGYLTINNRFF